MAELTVRMFGNPSVSVGGHTVTFTYRKADALLYYLILRKRVVRSEVAGLLWEHSDAAAALKNLRHAVYTIRKGLGFDIFSASPMAVLELRRDVALHCDVFDFLEGGSLTPYQGEFLENFTIPSASLYEDWLTEQRNLFHTQYLKRLLAAAKDAFHRGDLVQAEQLSMAYVQMDPLEESAAVILMELYGGNGLGAAPPAGAVQRPFCGAQGAMGLD